MSKKIIWFEILLELLGVPDVYSFEAVEDLQSDLDMRPHLRDPKVTWDDKAKRILVKVLVENIMDIENADKMAKEAGDQAVEDILEAASGSIREFKSLSINVLNIKY